MKKPRRGISATASILVTTAAAAGAQVPLSSGPSFSDVFVFEVSSTGYVVYLQDAVTDGSFELWSVELKGGTPVLLSGVIPSAESVFDFAISPDGLSVYYSAPEVYSGYGDVFRVPIGGGAATRLSPDLGDPNVAGTEASVLFEGSRGLIVDQTTGRLAMRYFGGPESSTYVTSPQGAAPVHSYEGTTFGFYRDGTRAVVTEDTIRLYDLDSGQELWGGVQGLAVVDLATSPNDEWLTAFEFGGDVWRVRMETGDAVVVTAPGDAARAADVSNSGDVVYRAFRGSASELFSTLASGNNQRVSGAMTSGGNVRQFWLTDDGAHVVYLADQQTDDIFELYTVPVAGGTVTKLNQPFASPPTHDADVSSSNLEFVNDRVVFFADSTTDGSLEMFSAPIDGSTVAVNISGSHNNAETLIRDMHYAPSGDFVVFTRRTPLFDFFLWRGWIAPLDGSSAPLRIWSKSDYSRSRLDAARGRLVLLARQVLEPDDRLTQHPLTEPVDDRGLFLTPPAASTGEIFTFVLAEDGTAVYVGDVLEDGKFELFAAPPPIFLDGFEAGSASAWSSSTG